VHPDGFHDIGIDIFDDDPVSFRGRVDSIGLVQISFSANSSQKKRY
jgi:hypothetical protein